MDIGTQSGIQTIQQANAFEPMVNGARGVSTLKDEMR